jgi:hypothetical protein
MVIKGGNGFQMVVVVVIYLGVELFIDPQASLRQAIR